LVVGRADVLPKTIVHRRLEPAFALENGVQIVCREGRTTEAFLGELAQQAVDVVLSDSPAAPGGGLQVFNHLLGECGTAFFATPKSATALRRQFPDSLDGMPFVLPGNNAALRRTLEQWFDDTRIRPKIVAEVDDVSLVEVLGEAGTGLFAVPDAVEDDVAAHFRVSLVGRVPELRQHFYAISVERKLKHPAVVAICDVSRKKIFGESAKAAVSDLPPVLNAAPSNGRRALASRARLSAKPSRTLAG
jgi:LysR family transcriptional regulator, transcriptional activator of nhaA